ncbi:ergothioneine biosynthesis protein EgtB [Thermoleophilum album]|uniref:Iron(II)-dependent oxidoreductase n=1 Tax=Thermoleophilum album TaxID=29539 RepID=A0A1H6FHT0_THEAL|nr:ergothioneine biosynthesis protein EgtB [Thermoleophilum album]SEH10389.1 iron(II)-dependent oxidoreductase [Thermoleophilum album]
MSERTGANAADAPERTVDRWRERLENVRERTLAVVQRVDEGALDRVFSPILSPVAWDLGHIAAFADLWLCERAAGLAPLYPELRAVYDALETPRSERGCAPYLRAREAFGYLDAVLTRSVAVLEQIARSGDPIARDGFVVELVARHEQQHLETILQTLQIAPPGVFEPPSSNRLTPSRQTQHRCAGMVRIDGGRYLVGAPDRGFAYDNERPRHEVELAPFAIDRAPVTNGDFEEFIADGGYQRESLWSPEGWRIRMREGWQRPLFWTDDGGVRRFGETVERNPDEPVVHVSYYEAEAFARWAGKHLPSELEWEVAATHTPGASPETAAAAPARAPREANCDLQRFAVEPVWLTPSAVSPLGAVRMIGDVWEWTASEFNGYPGFRPFPYREYSQVHFGRGYRVLRGGSWATQAEIAIPTFRNWDLPHRRQIFAGLRCAADV